MIMVNNSLTMYLFGQSNTKVAWMTSDDWLVELRD